MTIGVLAMVVSTSSFAQSGPNPPNVTNVPAGLNSSCDQGLRGVLNGWIVMKGGMTVTGQSQIRTTVSSNEALAILDSLLVNECSENNLVIRNGFFATNDDSVTDTFFVNFRFSDDSSIPADTIAASNLIIACSDTTQNQMISWIRDGGGSVINDACRGAIPWTRFTWSSGGRSGNGDNGDGPFNNIIDGTICDQTIAFTFFGSNSCEGEVSQIASFELFLDSSVLEVERMPNDLDLDCTAEIGESITNWYNDNAGFIVSSLVSSTSITANKPLDSVLNEFSKLQILGCDDYTIEVGFSAMDTFGMTVGPFSAFINVKDKIRPTLSSNASDLIFTCRDEGISLQLEQWIKSYGGAIAVDNCSDSVIWIGFSWLGDSRSGSGNFSGGPFDNIIDTSKCEQSFLFTFNVEDLCGNRTDITTGFEILDTVIVITSLASGINIPCEILTNPTTSITSWYNQSGQFSAMSSGVTLANSATKTLQQVIAEFNASIMEGCNEGMVTVGYFAIDDRGISSDTSFAKFMSEDNTGPTITTAPNNISFDCGTVDSNIVKQWLMTQGGAKTDDICSDTTFWTSFSWTSSSGATGMGDFVTGPFTIIDGLDCFESANVTFFAADPCGNATTTSALFSIQDTTPLMDMVSPVITQNPENVNIDCSVDVLDSLMTWYNNSGGLVATDENSVIKLRSVKSFALVQQDFNASNTQSNCASGTVSVGFFALDTLDNSSDTVFAVFSAVDSIPPNINTPAQNITHQCNAGRQDSLTNWIKRFGGAVAQDDCSGEDIIWAQFSFLDSDGLMGTGSFQNGPFNFIGQDVCNWSVDVSFFVTDACGNLTSTTATFTINDSEAPVFSFILPDTLLNCDNVPSATAIVANDGCEGQIMATVVDSSTQSAEATSCEFFNYQIFRTYTASDVCGNEMSFTQLITISDTLEPRYEAPADITISCLDDSNPNITGRPVNVVDNCSSEVVITHTDSPIGEGCERIIIRTWEIKDLCGSSLILPQTITIKDTIPPVIAKSAQELILNCSNAENVDQSFAVWVADFAGAEASDECGNRVTSFAAVPGSYDMNDPSTFPGENPGMLNFVMCPSTETGSFRLETVDFVFVDECGNAIVSTASFKIVDNIAPIISGGGRDTTLVITNGNSCSINLLIPALRIEDACGDLDNSFSMTDRYDIGSRDFGNEQVPVDSFRARFGPFDADALANNEPVVLRVQMINIDADDPTEYFNIVAEDGTDLGRTPLTPVQCGDAEFSLTFTASQARTWAADGFIEIDFLPNIPAGLSGALAINDVCFGAGTRMIFSLNVNLNVQGFIDYKIKIDDNVPITLDNVEDHITSLEAGLHIITYLVSDCAGNSSSKSYQVVIQESTPPVVSCPSTTSTQLTLGNCTFDYVLPPASSVTDNCNLADTFSYSVSGATDLSMISYSPNTETKVTLNKGTNVIEYIVFDGSGNSASCTFNISVLDIEPPVITCRDTSVAQAHPSGLLPLLVDPAIVVASVTDNCEVGDYQFMNTDFNCSSIDSFVAVTVVVSDLSGNTSQCVSNVKIIPFVLDPLAQSLVCTGDTLKFFANVPPVQAQNPYSFDWAGPNNFSSDLENPVIPNSTPDLSGTYTVVVVGANRCRSTGTVNVTIEDFNMPMMGANRDSICAGDTVTFTATNYQSQVTYKWFVGRAPAGTQLGITNIPSFKYSPNVNQTTFYVIAENEACETTPSGQVIVKVNPIPQLDVGTITIQICEKGSFQLRSNYTGTEITKYSWIGPNGFTSNEANPSTFNNVTPDQSGDYTLVVEENGCPSPLKITRVVVQPFPITPVVNVDAVICEGENLILSLTDTPANTGTLNWLLNGQFYEAVVGNGLIIQNANEALEGLWQVYVEDGACSSDTSNGVLVTIDKKKTITILNDTLLCTNDEVQLKTNIIPDASYEWSGPNNFRSILEQPIATIAQGRYSVTVTTASGCENVAHIDITASPRPMVFEFDQDVITQCVSGSETILVIATAGPDDDYSFEWTGPNNFVQEGSTLILADVTAAQSGTYSVIAKNDICESEKKEVTINLTDIPEVPVLGQSTSVCVGESLTLSVQNHSDLTERYVWTTPMGMFETDVPTFSIPGIGIANAGIYLVRAANNGCISNDSELLTINVFSIPRAPGVSSNVPLCEGDDLILQATQIVGAEYIWNGPNAFVATGDRVVIRNTVPANEGDYSVQIVLNGCPSLPSTLTDIEFLPTPDQPFTEENQMDVCIDDMGSDMIMLCINPPQYNPDGDYLWTNLTTEQVIGRTSERCLVLSEGSPIVIGENRIIVEEINDVCNSDASDILSFVLYERLDALANGGPDIIACDFTNVVLDAFNPNQGTGRWRALDPDINFEDPTNPKSLVFDINPGENILIWQLENGACTGDIDTILVITEFSIVANDDQVKTTYNTPIILTPEINDDLTEAYNITIISPPRAGTVVSGANGFEFTPENGFLGPVEIVYEVCSEICPTNCDRGTVVVEVGDVSDCFAPSLITPNGDGINDAFVIPCIESGLYPDNQLYIYNQYGDQVLDAPNYNNDWEGQYNGTDLPTGTYYYVFRANNQLAPEKGFIIIER